ncbi:hypothetical protein FDP41_013724 [Naegleria fowleri]|uniref:C2 domain-containing protein n=1 Tax=Naegleria fowleri TaxID=5763 RepID=A0A6A5C3S1_NAEFO|nr:uncharacterized protein FDP41_013724 [Naegleria fowleri]KAF0980510.1 hypothetical protein FDP41_013724 [Naegleria fowleri]
MPILEGDSIRINIIKANDLIPMDVSGSSDPYVILSSALNFYDEIKTSIVKKNLNPIWENEEYSFRSPKDRSEGWTIKFRVMDYDRMKKDDFLGDAELVINDDRFKVNSGKEEQVVLPLKGVKSGTLTVGISLKRSSNGTSTTPGSSATENSPISSPRGFSHSDSSVFRVDNFPYFIFKVPKRFKFDPLNKKKKIHSISCFHHVLPEASGLSVLNSGSSSGSGDSNSINNNSDHQSACTTLSDDHYEHLTFTFSDNILQEMNLEKAKLYTIFSLKKTHKDYSRMAGHDLMTLEEDLDVTSLFDSQFSGVYRWQWFFWDFPEKRKTRVIVYMILPVHTCRSLITVVYKTTLASMTQEEKTTRNTVVVSNHNNSTTSGISNSGSSNGGSMEGDFMVQSIVKSIEKIVHLH